jgi:hypothetical protein
VKVMVVVMVEVEGEGLEVVEVEGMMMRRVMEMLVSQYLSNLPASWPGKSILGLQMPLWCC